MNAAHPDAELLRLDAMRQALQAKYEAMEAEYRQLRAGLPKMVRANWQVGVSTLRRLQRDMRLPPVDNATKALLGVAIKHGRELDRQERAALKDSGVMRLRRQINAVMRTISRLEDRIEELPATTAAAAAAKLRLAVHLEQGAVEYPADRLMRDALAALDASGEGAP